MGEVSSGLESPGLSYTEWAACLFDPAGRHAKPEARHGIGVLDVSVIILGPATVDVLGELEARMKLPCRPPLFDTERVLERRLGPRARKGGRAVSPRYHLKTAQPTLEPR